jgi:hypothetical protein
MKRTYILGIGIPAIVFAVLAVIAIFGFAQPDPHVKRIAELQAKYDTCRVQAQTSWKQQECLETFEAGVAKLNQAGE